MNLMRKLRGASASSSTETPESSNSSSHVQLGLMHLKKLFAEYTHPPQTLSEAEKDDKLYNMLPLFCKVFGTSPSSEMNEKFWDILSFCQQVSKLMVSEIRKRASNQSTVAASCAIAKFLEIENSEESSNGWMLLSTLNLLAAGDQSLIQVMTTAAIPSTLVKCLYLFFDLPEIPDSEADIQDVNSDFTPRERRILLQKIFVQVLVRLCSHSFPCEELARKDDLSLLFSAITSWCAPHNIMWRKSAAEVLMTLSRHGLTQPVVQYIHNKGCVALCIENMQRIPELTPLEVVEMFVAVFCFLKDSSEVSQLLLDDFRSCQGYLFLSEFLLKHEKQDVPDYLTSGLEEERVCGTEARAALRNLVLMISSLCACGFSELRPTRANTELFQLQGFVLPQPTTQGQAVRNVQAFQVLQSVFIKSNSPALCCTILDAISSVYHADNANYFILENQNTLSQFSERIYTKNAEIQEKFFELLEFIVFQLNFVPCKELISLSLLLKANKSRSCSILCLKTLLNILKHNTIFKDVYREVGMLEVFVTCLSRYAVFLKDKQILEEEKIKREGENSAGSPTAPERRKRLSKHDSLIKDPNTDVEEEELGTLVMEGLTALLNGNTNNCNVFRDCGGAKCVHGMVVHESCRTKALGVIRELIVSGSGEEDMSALLCGMHAAPNDALRLKLHILKALLACLRDSHRTRTIFRKVSGFVYVTSVLVSLEGKLKGQELMEHDMLQLIHIVFYTISTAMRFEPANAKFFHHEICMTTLSETIRQLGCFTDVTELLNDTETGDPELYEVFHDMFTGNILEMTFPANVPVVFVHACIVLRLLYDVALDSFDKPTFCGSLNVKSPSLTRQSSAINETKPAGRAAPLNLSTGGTSEAWVIHSGVVIVLAKLLPALPRPQDHEDHARALRDYLAHVLKSLVRSERNQQVMCGAGLAGVVLRVCGAALRCERHPLHAPAMYMLERLAAHALRPLELREFLRMGNPLNCLAPEPGQVCKPGGPVPLTRIKTLVSMTTPRDYRSQNSCTLPPFVEFDMSAEGFGCLYLPSIAPQSANLNALGTQDTATLGGIGSGDRVFPPQTGLSYSTWICVEKYSDPRTDPHCVRLLTLVRNVSSGRDDHLVCLALVLSARDKAIIVSTQETMVPHNVGEWEPEGSGECGARVWCPDLQHEGQWHHLVLVLNRAVLKNSSFSLYLDGQHMHSGKLHYVSANPGGGAATLSGASSVYCVLGTPPQWRRYSRLLWRQGPALLLEEVLSAQTVSIIYQLGPHYVGTLQAPLPPGQNQEPLTPLVAEEKVVFGINARAMSQLTLAKIRKVYSKNDNKAIAKQLGMSSHENATPIRVLHNSAGHLMGPARCLGGTVVGYLGVRVFCPKPAAIMIDTVGGCSVLLGLIAMAQDVECLYAGVKALVCVVRSNKAAQAEMDRRKGYQTLAMLLKRKKQLLNSHILHLIFGLVGTVDSQKETSSIPNLTAFQDLICELEVWLGAPGGLIKSLLEHLLELATETAHRAHNLRTMRDLQLVSRLLYIISDASARPPATRHVLIQLLAALLAGQPRPNDLLCLGQFMAYTLPLPSQTEKGLNLIESDSEKECEGEQVILRNKCFNVLHGLLFTARNLVNTIVCEEISRVLGVDWLLSFMQENVHPTTVLWALRILVILCSGQGQPSSIMQRFREGAGNGGWLRHTEGSAAPQQAGVVLASAVRTHAHLHSALLHTAGFTLLTWLILYHLEVPELYYLLFGLMLGQPMRAVCSERAVCVDRVWSAAWGAAAPARQSPAALSARITLCAAPAVALLAAARALVHADPAPPDWLADHPVAIVQVLFSLYNTLPDFVGVMMTAEVLTALASTLFPPHNSDDIHMPICESGDSSGASTPGSEKEVVIPSGGALTTHPVRAGVMDFLKVIVLDSLSLTVTGKSSPSVSGAAADAATSSMFCAPCSPCSAPTRSFFYCVIDLVLDASPPNSTSQQQVEYQTEVLTTVMENLLNTELFGTESNISNVCYLAARLVDKLWQGQLSRDPHEVFDFIVKLVTQAKKKSSVISLEGLHHCLNRTILYLLSRSTDSIADQMSVLEALHKLTTNRLLIFGAGNHELEFIGCLTYCLLQLSANMKIALDAHMRTTWHVNPSGDLESRDDRLTSHQGRNLMAGAARRVWEELYACKKPAIEEVFKVTLSAPVGNARAPDLPAARDQLTDAAHRLWLNYIDTERKAVYRVPWELHNQIQSKIQKVTGGLTRLASRTKVKKEESAKQRAHLPREHALAYMQDHVQLVRQAWCVQLQTAANTSAHTTRYVQAEWAGAWRELTRERGLWGPPRASPLDKWALDSTEGPCRMRKMLRRNHHFYLHYPYRPHLQHPDNKQLKYKVAQSLDSKEYYRVYQQWRTAGNSLGETDCIETSDIDMYKEEITNNRDTSLEVTNEEGSPTDLVSSGVVSRGSNSTSGEANEDGPDVEDEDEQQSPPPDNQTLLRLLEHHEKISHMFRCARIQGLDTTEGLLLFGREHCYVIDGFTLLKNREIRDLDSCPDDYEPILPSQGIQRSNQRQCSKFLYEDIREVHKRRYLLQPIALEVFSSDGRNYLLAFPRKVRNKVYSRFTALATGMADSAAGSVAGQKRGVAVEQPAGLLASLIGDTSVTQRWLRGEISNFQYLMHLNTLAGRSYNDLMQYPVFPWILADYDSLELDLTDPATFRDLTKPMGAQSSDRLEQFRKRYKEWDDPHGETPPYHYGTHYSSAMIVCSYLVRMEPFTQHFLRLQGGHFDLADRMFHSIKEAWNSASRHNMADVKELIPEFFYLPEFLLNSNNFDLGCKQSGVALGDVVLPAWARGDPREFIRLHRAALECDYVSHRLHHWIDLVFGYKQQGQPAVDACNVFHHLFYEGNVDIYNIDDPLKKNATIGFINNFGQIPKQLFKKAHPSKKMSQRSSTILDPNNIIPSQGITPPEKLFFHNLENLRPSLQPVKEVKGPVGQILYTDKAILAVEQNKVLMPPAYNKYVAWGFADHSLRIGNYDSERAVFISEAAAHACGELVACVCPSDKTIVTAGTSTVVTVWQYWARRRRLAVKVCLYGHSEAVTCLAASAAYNLVVSGSRDGHAIVWDVERGSFVRQLLPPHLAGPPPPVSALAIDDLTGDIATCSGSWLHAWSINGELLGAADGGAGQQLLCAAFSQAREWDPLNVIITGSTDGVVRMFSIDYIAETLEEENQSQEVSEPITNLIDSELKDRQGVPSQDSECVTATESEVKSDAEDQVDEAAAIKRVEELVKQMSLSQEPEGNLTKSGSESSLSDACETTSAKESARRHEEKDTCSDNEEPYREKQGVYSDDTARHYDNDKDGDSEDHGVEKERHTGTHDDNDGEGGNQRTDKEEDTTHEDDRDIDIENVTHRSKLQKQGHVVLRRKSKANPLYRKSGGSIGESSESGSQEAGGSAGRGADSCEGGGEGLRTSKSDTSLSDSFVMLSAPPSPSPKPARSSHAATSADVSAEGAGAVRWRRRLVLRGKLTMHTAYERRDNATPAAVTAVAAARSGRGLAVGDARGRIFRWSAPDMSSAAGAKGGPADHWIRDDTAPFCTQCQVRFTALERRHHCRECGAVFCGRCTRYEAPVRRLRALRPVRVCQRCHDNIHGKKE
ncbi:PREDICTED: WD repeat and FYVE domain-containing protein 3 isoform X1 [Papilio xuthus]|uniref:WD repeat and FYVE domain-containing protein 3 isoform X1 n=1 Tax=Papilio xuthus TaxID=66420 RepID=A0AAJ6ZTM8_PAPXU|nr:PREDICTED: WD repeat and FYVE domain-containing protein 3 isoform X1 [Papilio xuthus]